MNLFQMLGFGREKRARQLTVKVSGVPRSGDIRAYVDGRHHCKLRVGDNDCFFGNQEFKLSILIDNLILTRIGIFGECMESNKITISNDVVSVQVSISEENIPTIAAKRENVTGYTTP